MILCLKHDTKITISLLMAPARTIMTRSNDLKIAKRKRQLKLLSAFMFLHDAVKRDIYGIRRISLCRGEEPMFSPFESSSCWFHLIREHAGTAVAWPMRCFPDKFGILSPGVCNGGVFMTSAVSKFELKSDLRRVCRWISGAACM